MKQLLLTPLLAFWLVAALAQENKGFFSLGVGASLPVADFGSTLKSQRSGYANTGLSMEMSGGYKLTQLVGGMVQFKNQLNSYRSEAAFPNIETQTNGWLMRSFMAGPYLTAGPDSGKVRFEGRLLLGICRTRTPEVTRVDLTGTGYSRALLHSEIANSFAWMLGLGLRFPLSERIGLGIHADYFQTRPSFKYDVIPGAPVQKTISTVTATLSVSYHFRTLFGKSEKTGVFDKNIF